MGENIQNKIDQYKALAKASSSASTGMVNEPFIKNDSLLKAIRTADEAIVFRSELQAAIQQARINRA